MNKGSGKGFRCLIVGYLRSKAVIYNKIVLVKLLDTRLGESIPAGRKVVLVDRHGNRYVGRIIGVHGSKGDIVKVRFKPNIPGQAINSIVVIE